MRIIGVGTVLLAVIAAISAESDCLCGGFDEGSNACREPGGGGCVIGVKAHRGPRPQHIVHPAVINEAFARREAAAAAAAAARRARLMSVTGNVKSVGCGESGAGTKSALIEHSGLTAAQLLALGSTAFIAPRFSAIDRDPCFGTKSALHLQDEPSKIIVAPAVVPKTTCSRCGGGATSYSSNGCASFLHNSASGSSGSVPSMAQRRGCSCGGSRTVDRAGMYNNVQISKTGFSRAGKSMEGYSAGGETGLIGFGTPCNGAGSAWGGAGTGVGVNGGLSAYGMHGLLGGIPNALGAGLSATTRGNACSCSAGLTEFELDESGPSLSFEEQEKIYNKQNTPPEVPADAVSVALAYKKILEPLQKLARGDGLGQGKGRIVSEASLSFGPRSIPVDGRVEKRVESDIPEERLNNVDKPIVELKLQAFNVPQGTRGRSYGESEQAQQDLIDRERLMQEEADCSDNKNGKAAYISYRDLGYGPAVQKGNSFLSHSAVTRTSQTSSTSTTSSIRDAHGAVSPGEEIPCGPLGAPLQGYVPGSVFFEGGQEKSKTEGSSGEVEGAPVSESEDVSYNSDEDIEVPTSSDGAASSGNNNEGVPGGRLSRLWTRVPAPVVDRCTRFM